MCLKKATDQGFQLALRGSWTPRRPGRSFYCGNQGYQSPRPFSSRSRPWASRQPFFNPGGGLYDFPSPFQSQNSPFLAPNNFGDSYYGNDVSYAPPSYGNQFSNTQYKVVEAPQSQFNNAVQSGGCSQPNQSSGDTRVVTFRSPSTSSPRDQQQPF